MLYCVYVCACVVSVYVRVSLYVSLCVHVSVCDTQQDMIMITNTDAGSGDRAYMI